MSEITSVSEYRDRLSKVQKIKLPSGGVFKIKRLSPLDYIKAGLADLPNEFYKFISDVSQAKVPDTTTEDGKKQLQLFDDFLRVSVETGIVDPPILMKYDKDKIDSHLLFGELELKDQLYIIQVITGKINAVIAE
jgi:hypothetical protein